MSQYDSIPHVEFNGFRIYMPDNKMSVIKSRPTWTIARVQREFKVGYNQALLLIQYAIYIGVVEHGVTNGNGTKYIVKPSAHRNSTPFTTDNTSHDDAVELLNRYHNVLKYAHNAILHEIDKGNAPTLIQEEHGGAGIGLIEDLLNEVE